MNRAQPEHAIRAACQVADDREVYVFGSQAVLGELPYAPETLRASIEIDIQPKNKPQAVDLVDGSLGELSLFHETYGFYVHGVSIESAALPLGWEGRAIPVCDPVGTLGGTGYCLELHDLAVSKLAAFREKDLDFVTTLLLEEVVGPAVLLERIADLSVDEECRDRLSKWVANTSASLSLPESPSS